MSFWVHSRIVSAQYQQLALERVLRAPANDRFELILRMFSLQAGRLRLDTPEYAIEGEDSDWLVFYYSLKERRLLVEDRRRSQLLRGIEFPLSSRTQLILPRGLGIDVFGPVNVASALMHLMYWAKIPARPVLRHLGLSEREADVFLALDDGLSVEDIATSWGISINTVRTHMRNIRSKLKSKRYEPFLAHARVIRSVYEL